jgi:pyochelin biosynthesis protein PchC
LIDSLDGWNSNRVMSAVTRNIALWFRRFDPAADHEVRLVCFPHAGGAATFYASASHELSTTMDVLAVQYPGRQDRRAEPCVDDLHQLAAMIADELRSLCDRPIVLFGHSMGATVAYEVARLLERDGAPVLGLFASGRRAPSTSRPETVHLRDDQGIIAAIAELDGTHAALLGDEELVRMIMPAIRGDYRAVETYRHRPGPLLRCPIQVLIGADDPMTTMAEAQSWQAHTAADCQTEVFPGGHFFLSSAAAQVLATVVRQVDTWRAHP